MSDTINETLDIASWILGGVLCGLLLLGIYNFYQTLQTPQHPQITLEPLSKEDVEPVRTNKNFVSPEQLQLVQRLSSQPTVNEESDTPAGQTDTPPEPPSSDTVQETELPFRLLGTTTGIDGYEMAIVRNQKEQKTRTLTVNEEWNELRVVEINGDNIRILNARTGEREKLTLNPKNSDR